MCNTIAKIEALLADCKVDEALKLACEALEAEPNNSSLLFMRGNIYMKRSEITRAVSDYARAKNIDSSGPATQAYDAAIEVLNFYHHDLYNP